MLLLLLCSALISGAEVAFFALSPASKEELEGDKGKVSRCVVELLQRPKKLLATILIANNFVNIAIVILSTEIVNRTFDFGSNQTARFAVQVVAVGFLILLVGEVLPKVYASRKGLQLARFMAFPLNFLNRIFRPISYLLVQMTSIIDRSFKKTSDISVDHLEHALELTDEKETSKEEQKLLEGIVKFGNVDADQIMKPRTDVVAFEENMPFRDLIQEIVAAGYSRVPIFAGSLDQIKGVLYIKDLLAHRYKSNDFNWNVLIREPFFIPENKKIDDLLKEFQEGKIHIAIVVDEYGGTSGIVTLEDVIEEIIGEIVDEFEDDGLAYSKLDNDNYVFEGKTALVDMYRVLEIGGEEFERAKGEANTIAGFLIEQAGKILLKNEKVVFNNFTFAIEAADRRRIKQVKITKLISVKEDSVNNSE